MKVILFIGQHKVGSTALQTFLAKNSVALLRAGILYPSVDFEGCSVMMAKLLRGKDDDDTLSFNAREPHNALAFRMLNDEFGRPIPPWHKVLPTTPQMLRAIKMQIQYLKPEVVVLTSEVFSNFAAEAPAAIKKLAGLFEGHEVRILVTLRRVDDYLTSWHGQRLKFGYKSAPLRNSATREYINGIHFDYKLMLGKWFDEFPDADFVLRNYNDVLKSGGSCEDFAAHSGVDFPAGLHSVASANPSLHPALHEIARIGNKELKADQASGLRGFLVNAQTQLNLPQSKSIEMFGVENRELMANKFAPIHEYLSKKNRGGAFFSDIDEISSVRDINELDAVNDALAQIQSKNGSTLTSHGLSNDAKNLLANMRVSNS